MELGLFKLAQLHLETALEISREGSHGGFKIERRVLEKLSQLHLLTGDTERAMDYAKEVAQFVALHSTGDASELVGAHRVMGMALEASGDLLAARRELELAVAAADQGAVANKDLGTARMRVNLGIVLERLGEPALAAEHYLHALRTMEEALGPKGEEVAAALQNLAAVTTELGDHGRALGYLERATEMERERLGDNAPRYGVALNNLSAGQVAAERWDDAEISLRRSIQLLEVAPSPYDTLLAYPVMGLADLLERRNRAKEAMVHAKRALALWESVDQDAEDRSIALFVMARLVWADDHKKGNRYARAALQAIPVPTRPKDSTAIEIREWMAQQR